MKEGLVKLVSCYQKCLADTSRFYQQNPPVIYRVPAAYLGDPTSPSRGDKADMRLFDTLASGISQYW